MQFCFQSFLRLVTKSEDIGELALYLSRCLILWKMGLRTNEELLNCLEGAIQRIDINIDKKQFDKTLLLELYNYQFLNLKFPKWVGKVLAKTINIVIFH